MMSIEMPILRPVPIPLEVIAAMENKDLPLWERIKAWRKTNRKWEVMEDWSYGELYYEGSNLKIPKGFIFDGASIPRCLWWFLSPVGLLLIAGLVHDYHYKHKSHHRDDCDLLFRDLIRIITGTTIIPWIAWAAVRIGGWKAWKEHRENDKTLKKLLLNGIWIISTNSVS